MITVFGMVALGCAALIASGPTVVFIVVLCIVMCIALTCVVIFWSMTVAVQDNELVLYFGSGFFRQSILLSAVSSAGIVTMPWSAGWGIRCFSDGYWYAVSGRDAVEVGLQGGQRYVIGTDDPGGLLAAIRATGRVTG